MRIRIALARALLLVLTVSTSPVYAHSGGTDQNGCHVESSTGIEHCHNTTTTTPTTPTTTTTSPQQGGGYAPIGESLLVAGVVVLIAWIYHWTAADYWPILTPDQEDERDDTWIHMEGTDGQISSVRVFWKLRF